MLASWTVKQAGLFDGSVYGAQRSCIGPEEQREMSKVFRSPLSNTKNTPSSPLSLLFERAAGFLIG